MTKISLHSIVLLMGVTKSGKTTWAHEHFPHTEVLSIDALRPELLGRPDNFTCDRQLWQEIHRRARVRLLMGQRVVVDANNLKSEDRKPWTSLSQELGVPLYYVLMNPTRDVIQSRAAQSGVPTSVWERQHQMLLTQMRQIRNMDASDAVWVPDPDQVQVVPSMGVDMGNRILVVADVHGDWAGINWAVDHAKATGRSLVFLGDVVDYGGQNLRCMKLVYDLVMQGSAHMIWGNHERKIDRWMSQDWGRTYRGRLSEANLCTIREIQSLSLDRRIRFECAWRALSNQSTQHLVLGNWMMTHGAAHEHMWHMQGHRLSGELANLAYFGEVDSVNPQRSDGYPNRIWNWVNQVPAGHFVVVGHDYLDRETYQPVIKTNSQGGTVVCLDTGNSKGGRLSVMELDLDTNQYHMLQYQSE